MRLVRWLGVGTRSRWSAARCQHTMPAAHVAKLLGSRFRALTHYCDERQLLLCGADVYNNPLPMLGAWLQLPTALVAVCAAVSQPNCLLEAATR